MIVNIRIRQHPAIKSDYRRRDFERPEQHEQAARWPGADDGKYDFACVQFCHGRPGARGQNLIVGHQRPVDIRDNGRNFGRGNSGK